MENNDKSLLEWYYKGFRDESYGTTSIESNVELENVAYKLGSSLAESFVVSGNLMILDDLPNPDEILELIKKYKQ